MKNTVSTWTCDGCGKVEKTEAEDYPAQPRGWVCMCSFGEFLMDLWSCSVACRITIRDKEAKRLRELPAAPLPTPPPKPRSGGWGDRE